MRKTALAVATTVFLLSVFSGAVAVAQDSAVPHEDPEAATTIYDAIAILDYCSRLIDGALDRAPVQVASRVEKQPFANVPAGLTMPLEQLGEASADIASLIIRIEADLEIMDGLARQFRLEEVIAQRQKTEEKLALAYDRLLVVEESVATAGDELDVPPPDSQAALRAAYQRLLDMTTRLRELLALLRGLLGAMPGAIPGASPGGLPWAALRTTEISLSVEPTEAFVGDRIEARGNLISDGTPLPDRSIVLLLDGQPHLTTRAGPDGSYLAEIRIPYSYVPSITVEALYYPRDADVGRYLASRSSPVEVRVRYYDARLRLSAGGSWRPGQNGTIQGRFDYGDSPVPAGRTIEVYLDGRFISRSAVGQTFEQTVSLTPDTAVGRHSLLVVVPGQEEYAPASAKIMLVVEQALTIIELSPPAIAMLPFALDLKGRAYSSTGPLRGAAVEVGFAGSTAVAITDDDGVFTVRLRTGMDISLIGSRRLDVTVHPAEPWNAPAGASWRLVVANPILMGILSIIVAVLAASLSRRMRAGDIRARSRELPRLMGQQVRQTILVCHGGLTGQLRNLAVAMRMMPAIVALSLAGRIRAGRWRHPEDTPDAGRHDPRMSAVDSQSERPRWREGRPGSGRDLRRIILELYGRLIGLLQGLTGTALKPEWTLREFVARCGPMLGPGQRHLETLTRLVERVLYSQHSPQPADLEVSRRLSRQVEEAAERDSA